MGRKKNREEDEDETDFDYSTNYTEGRHNGSFSDYFCSYQIIEMIFFLCYAAGVVVASSIPTIIQKPLPFVMAKSGETIYDPAYSNDLIEPALSDMMVLLTSISVPLAIQIGLSLGVGFDNDTHNTICTYAFSIGTTIMITNLLQTYTSMYRPNFFAGCQFDAENNICLSEDSGFYRTSFPSFNSGISFCCMYLIGRYFMRVFADEDLDFFEEDIRAQNKKLFFYRLKCIMSMSPIVYAYFVATSQLIENYHFPADVVAGALIGFSVAYFANTLWFPPLPGSAYDEKGDTTVGGSRSRGSTLRG